MIQIIVFSFNRAMQLDTLLTSFMKHWKQPKYKIDVVYNYSTEAFGRGYEKFAKEYEDKPVTLHRESNQKPDRYLLREILCPDNAIRLWRTPKLRQPKTNFRRIVLEILDKSEAENVMFLTDDSMFISDITIPSKVLLWINEKPSVRQFSLRLGKGVSTLPETITIDDGYCIWDMYDNQGNWGYPFSVDAHIYNNKYVLELYKKYVFTSPNTLEANICSTVRRNRWLGKAQCFTDIKMLTFPINIVQNAVDNLSLDVSVEMLNDRYLKGEHLKYVVDKEYNATKQYVRQIEFTDANGKNSILSISDELTRPNADLSAQVRSDLGRNKNEISVIIAGDYSPKERLQRAIDKNEWKSLFPGVQDLLKSADYSIVNFESTIIEQNDRPIEKIGSHLKTTYPSMFVLKSLGFDMITLANNHSLDYGAESLLRTIREANRLGMESVGAGDNLNEARLPKKIKIKDKEVAIINCCEHEFSIATETEAGANPLDIVEIAREIKECKESADFVLLIIHGGLEHYQLPTPRMKKLYRYFVECGADAVVNHHQHCYSGSEYYKGKPIVYGLGNFCFDSANDIRFRHDTYNYGFMVKLFLSDNINFEIIPYEQCYKRPGVYLIEGNEKDLFFKDIEKLNVLIADDKELNSCFDKIAKAKRNFIFRGFRPYSGRIFNALYYRGLLPSFLSKERLKTITAILECEAHNDVLMQNLKS